MRANEATIPGDAVVRAETTPARRPKLLLASILVALLIMPAILLASHLATAAHPGGDGLVGFWEAVIIYLLGIVLSWALAIIGLIRGERPRWLAVVTVLLGIAPLLLLVFDSAAAYVIDLIL